MNPIGDAGNENGSTLLQLLIPLHFNSPRINTYRKPRESAPPFYSKVLQLVTTPTSPRWTRKNASNSNSFKHFRTPSVTPGVYPSHAILPVPSGSDGKTRSRNGLPCHSYEPPATY
jgi:hypothetical protein